MARLIYVVNASLDGYIEDAEARIDWGTPDEEYYSFINDLQRRIGTYLYGRRMYETMLYFETNSLDDEPAYVRDFTQIWRDADKIVFSRSLTQPSSAKTRMEQEFEPNAVRRMKADVEQDMSIGGADLAGQAIRAGLVDELRLFTWPLVVGGGKPWLPKDVCLALQLVDSHRFANGVLYSSYRLNGQQ